MHRVLQFGEDSRLKGHGGRVTHAVLPLERTYCSNCGRPWGWASQDSSQQIAAAEIIVFCQECFASLSSSLVAQGESSRPEGSSGPFPFQRIAPGEMNRLGLLEEDIR